MVGSLTRIDSSQLQDRPKVAQTAMMAANGAAAERAPRTPHAPRRGAVEIRISDEALAGLKTERDAKLNTFAASLEKGLIGLDRGSTSVFTALGMSPASAEMAMTAVNRAIRSVAGQPPLMAEVLSFSTSNSRGEGDFARATLVIKKAGLYWDPAQREFAMTTRNVTLSVALGNLASIVPLSELPPAEGQDLVPFKSFDLRIPVEV